MGREPYDWHAWTKDIKDPFIRVSAKKKTNEDFVLPAALSLVAMGSLFWWKTGCIDCADADGQAVCYCTCFNFFLYILDKKEGYDSSCTIWVKIHFVFVFN